MGGGRLNAQKILIRLGLAAFTAALLVGCVWANWPQWRGPESNGTAPNAHDLPVTWSDSRNVLWRTKLPSWSAATPAVWRDWIFLTSTEEGSPRLRSEIPGNAALDKIFLMAINRKDGSVLWQRQIDSGNKLFRKQNSASPSPITDGRHVWIMTGNGKLICFTMDGGEVWKRDIQAEYGKFGLNHGYASTPLLHNGRLYVQVLHGMKTDEPSYILALDVIAGKTLWKVDRPTDARSESPDNYATPQMARVGGNPQLVISGADYVTGHDPDTGRELWRLGGFNPTNNPANRTIASSVVIGEKVFTPSTRGRPLIAFRAGGAGDITGKSELWTNNLGADVPTPTTDGKYLYVLGDSGIMNCIEAETGNVAYQGKRIENGTYSASPLLADGKIYCINEDGTTTVVKTGPVFEVLGVSRLESLTLASPVAVDNQIFIRTADHLYCIQQKQEL